MKKLYYLLFIIISLISCKTDSFTGVGEEGYSNVVSNYNFGSTTQKDFQGVVLDTNGAPIYGATVQIGTTSVTTNYKGLFSFKNASVQENFAHIKVTKAGFVNASRVLVPSNGVNRVNIMMIPVTLTSTVSSGATSTVSLADGTKVKFDGSFKDANGNSYSGSVSVSLYHLAPSNTNLNELMPGSFLATSSNGSARVMETFGMLHVQLTGSAGQNLQIATGHTAEITVPVDASQSSTSPSTISLWSYNESTGMWNEEGSATKVGNTYVGTVSHFSWWNCDAQFPQATLKVTVKNNAGQPLVNAKVTLKRNSQTYEVSGITDNNGTVTGIIPAGESLTLKVYDNCNSLVYTSTVAPVAVGTLFVLPDIVVTPTGTNYLIQGNLKTCANANVTDGFVTIKVVNGSNNFQYVSVPVSSTGIFSTNIYSCTPVQQFVLEAFDVGNLQTSGEINFTPSSSPVSFNNLMVCNSVGEFISYKIDNDPIKYVVGNFNAQWFNGMNPNPNNPANQLTIGTANSAAGPNVYSFYMVQNGMMGTVGSFPTSHEFEFTGGYFSSSNSTVTLNVTSFGAVGDYIDFNASGTYVPFGTTVTKTFTCTGHVKRDL